MHLGLPQGLAPVGRVLVPGADMGASLEVSLEAPEPSLPLGPAR